MYQASFLKRKTFTSFLAMLFLLISFSSCYTVLVVSRDGVAEPDPQNTAGNFYRGKKVYCLDTVITLKIQDGEFYMIQKCASGGFYSFEYRSTFGGVLLSAVTLGRKRQVKVKYVCLKQSD